MAALIKGALVKQISKFLKNVTSNQINISTLKGEGEMKNIELDENVLMDLLELPTWLRITNARCNKANVKIQWTKLKTNPIIIYLDKIELDVEIADPLREYSTSSASKMFDKDNSGAYGFIDKCIDAIQLIIDSINVTIKSKNFNANLEMSNICVYSTTPNWKTTNDIRNTRLKDLEKDEIILFKEVAWEICRLEAYTTDVESQTQSGTSIKLIMNPSKIHIVLKKRLSDKSLINSTIHILLNEIYWMASDTQLKAAIGTYKTLSKLMTKSFNQKKKFIHIQQQQANQKANNSQAKNTSNMDKASSDILSKVFLQYDIKETSIHLQISNLNISLYADDNYSGNKLIDGGSMQFLFKNVCIDHYPYHKVGSSTKHWNNYNHTFQQRDDWSKNLFDEFVSKLEGIINLSNIKDLNQIRLKNNINLLESCTLFSLKDFCIYKVTTNLSNKNANAFSMKSKKNNSDNDKPTVTYNSLNDFLKMKDYFIEQQMFNARPFLSSNSAEFNLPGDTLFLNCFFSEFYFPEDINYPVPSPQIYVQISPILINIDFLTLLWVNTLAFSLWREKLIVDQNDKEKGKPNLMTNSTKNILHCDSYLELILPKINLSIYPSKINQNVIFTNENFIERPKALEIGIARLVITNQTLSKFNKNFTNFESTSQKSYKIVSNLIEKNSNFNTNIKKSNLDSEIQINNLAPCFNEIVTNENSSYQRCDINNDLINTTKEAVSSKIGLFLKSLNKNALNKNASKDVWNIEIDSLWIDMVDKENLPFVQNLSFNIYLVNVWDFLTKDLTQTQNHLNDKISSNSCEMGYKKAYKRLEKIIEIQNSDQKVTEKIKFRKRSNSASHASKLIHNQTKSEFICKKIYSNLNVITEIKHINVYINHSQILFLLRLVEVIDNFTKQMEIDTENTLKFKGHSGKDFIDQKDKKAQFKSFKLDDLLDEVENEAELTDASSLNFALIVNNIEVELAINDMRKDIRFEPNLTPYEDESINEPKNTIDPIKNEQKEIEKSDEITKEDFDIIAKQLDKEFMLSYVKYVYGLSTENPNNGLSFNIVQNPKDLSSSSSIDSGIQSSEKTSIFSNFSNKASAGLNKLTSKISDSNDIDPFLDDNDNMSLILSLTQDDTSSLISQADVQNLMENLKNSPSRSLSSASDVSSFTNSLNQLKQPDDQLRSYSFNSNIGRAISNTSQIVQTNSTQTKVKLNLKNLNVYLQTINENLTVLIDLEQIRIRDRKSSCKNIEKSQEILAKFKKISDDKDSQNGLVEIFLDNYSLELDIPTLTGIVDLVDDNDDFSNGEKKESIGVRAFVKNCGIKLNDDPFNPFENNPKILSVSVEQIQVDKTPDNRLIINEIKLENKFDLDAEKLKSKLTMNHEFKFVQESKSDMSCMEFRSKLNLKIDSNKFASLVLMLRKQKEENFQLQTLMDQERIKFKTQEEEMMTKMNLFEKENRLLKLELENLKQMSINNQNISVETQETNGFVVTDKNEENNLSLKLEVERKQFESLLNGYQEENELLKSKLRKTEDYVALLNIERECLMKKLNQSKF
ncbi:unnamed protein product [Brachionus calyciflorus]|uniref:Uncharacterized protein n=1 Tax=Brachionus calyciflorus TaxID=104777 RepID=A0A813MC04_9BILA|nr:unnamed protein product [Brachionus calyciflorus]